MRQNAQRSLFPAAGIAALLVTLEPMSCYAQATSAGTPPVIGVSSSSVSFRAQQGAANPPTQSLRISNSGGGTLKWTATTTAAWLRLSPASGTNTGTITVTATTSALAAGTHTGTISVRASGARRVSLPVTVTVTVPPAIRTSLARVSFTAQHRGSNPPTQSLRISNSGGGTLKWTATTTAAWLRLSPASGTNTGMITVTATTSALAAGTHTGTISVRASGARRVSLPVSVTVTAAAASLTITSGNLAFTATQGRANPSTQAITLNSTGTWTAKGNASWLSLSPTSGSKNGNITASVNTANANLGNNSATVTVTSGGVTKTTNVTLTLNTPSSSSVTLTWNANTESDLAGYKVYRATASGAYGAPIATVLRTVTTYQATGLQFGTTYFFVVTAFDIAGNESAYSNEVSKSIF